jgi:hypothetical protein
MKVDFNRTAILFKHKSLLELTTEACIYKLCGINSVLRFAADSLRPDNRSPIAAVTVQVFKRTVLPLFYAGETFGSCVVR